MSADVWWTFYRPVESATVICIILPLCFSYFPIRNITSVGPRHFHVIFSWLQLACTFILPSSASPRRFYHCVDCDTNSVSNIHRRGVDKIWWNVPSKIWPWNSLGRQKRCLKLQDCHQTHKTLVNMRSENVTLFFNFHLSFVLFVTINNKRNYFFH